MKPGDAEDVETDADDVKTMPATLNGTETYPKPTRNPPQLALTGKVR